MARLFRATLALLILTAAPVILVRLFGSALPHAPVASLFLNPDGTPCTAPCILGIRPGETNAQEVASALTAHPLVDNSRAMEALKNTYLFAAKGDAISLAFSTEPGGEVNYVRVSFVERPGVRMGMGLTLGDVVREFGAPDLVVDCSKPNSECWCGYILVFLDAGLEVFVPLHEPIEDRLRPNYWLTDFIVLRLRTCPDHALDVPTRPWTGFTAMSPYLKETGIRIFYQPTDRLFPMVCQAPRSAM